MTAIQSSPTSTTEQLGKVLLGLLFGIWALSMLLWIAAQVTAVVSGHGLVATSASEAPLVAKDLFAHQFDLRETWPEPGRADLGPVPLTWGLFAVEVAATAGVSWRALRWWTQRPNRTHSRMREIERARSEKWANPRTAKELMLNADEVSSSQRQVLGRLAGQTVAMVEHTSLAIVAPPGSGKTNRFVIPELLRRRSPTLACSTKPDVLELTETARREFGPVWVFDPTGSTGREDLVRWSPLVEIEDYASAQTTARWLAEAIRVEDEGSTAHFWETLGVRLLAPMLYAAAMTGRELVDVSRWVDYRDEDGVQRVLEELGDEDALAAWAATCSRPPEQKQSVFGTAEVIFEAFASSAIRHATTGRLGDPGVIRIRDLLDGGSLYLIAPAATQKELAPVFQAVVSAVIRTAAERHTGTGLPLDPALLVMLDEAANIAPLRDLDTVVTTMRAAGVVICTVWQDEAQVERIYGSARARTVLSNHSGRVTLPGVLDTTTLQHLSTLIGRHLVSHRSISRSDTGSATNSEGVIEVDLAPVDWLRQLQPDQAVLLAGRYPPALLDTTPWYEDAKLRALIPQEVVDRYDRAYGKKTKDQTRRGWWARSNRRRGRTSPGARDEVGGR